MTGITFNWQSVHKTLCILSVRTDWIGLALHLSHSRSNCCSAQLRSFKWITQCRKKWSVIRHVMKEVLKNGSKGAGCGKEPLEERDGERQLRQRNVYVAKVIREMESRDGARVREKGDKNPGWNDYISISITSQEITDVTVEQVAWPTYKEGCW